MSDVDILGRIERRRVWTVQEKAVLLAEIDAVGGKVRLVARRHRISESVLYNWRSARKAAAVAMGAPENVEFIPVGLIEGPASDGPAMPAPPNPEPMAADRGWGNHAGSRAIGSADRGDGLAQNDSTAAAGTANAGLTRLRFYFDSSPHLADLLG